jgi:hypothetical protein
VTKPSSDAARQANAVRTGAGLFAGFALLAAINALAIAVGVPLPTGGVPLRLLHHFFDAAETLGLGAMLATLAFGFVRFARVPPWTMEGVGFVVCVAIVYRVAGDYIRLGAAHAVDAAYATPLFFVWMGFYGVVLTVAPFVALDWLKRRWLRFLPLPIAVATLVVDHVLFRDDYMDMHGIIALQAVLLAAAALASRADRLGRALATSTRGKMTLAAIGLVAVLGIVVPPPNAARFELFRQPCAVAPWFFATTLWRAPSLHAPVVASPSRWQEDRSSAPPVAPTQPALLPKDAVVVLITIDALRADVVEDPKNEARFPTLTKLKREGVHFTHAYAPGAQTGVSMSTLFTGLYYSERKWENFGNGKDRHPYPAHDHSQQFPDLLSEHAVETVNYASLVFLSSEFGVARGFREEEVLGTSESAATGPRLTHALLNRLGHAGEGPLFLCTHMVEPHAPHYPLGVAIGRNRDADFDEYLSKIAFDDRLLGHVLQHLEEHFGDRWALFVSADHGEAFGEHQTTEHAKTLYEQLLHVPLLARSPRFPARTIDVGPTLLDLFGVPTPATFNGQSLVPVLAGGTASLTRPLFAEGRLRRALLLPDGLKVIEDLRRKVVEVYDVSVDPGETRNLFDRDPARSDAALAELRAFFDVHTFREDGYEVPYKL